MHSPLKRVVLWAYRLTPSAWRMRVVRYMTPNFTAGVVTLVVRDNGDVLFLRMTYRRGWGLPGGLIGRGEAPQFAAQREITEELGISVAFPEIYRVHFSPTRQAVTFFTRVRVSEELVQNIRIDPVEIAGMSWFPAFSMPQLDQEIAPLEDADRAAVRDLLQGS